MKLRYDMKRNNELCNPHKFYEKFEGVHYVRTVIVRKKDVYFDPKQQPRAENQDINNVRELEKSFKSKNFDHKFRPSTADVNKGPEDAYDGTAGFNRDSVFNSLGIEYFPLDLLEFDSEYTKHLYRGISNNEPEHHSVAASMSQVAIVEQIKKSIREGYLPKNKDGYVTDKVIKEEIIKYTTLFVDGRSCSTVNEKDRKKMLEEVRKSFPLNPKLMTYNKNTIKAAAYLLGIPNGGYDRDTGKIGYVLTHTVGKDGIWNMYYANRKYGKKPIHIAFAIETPSNDPEKNRKKKEQLKKSLYDAIDEKAILDSEIYDLNVDEARKKLNESKPIKFMGFFNSYVDEGVDIKNGWGNHVMVDEKGNVLRTYLDRNK